MDFPDLLVPSGTVGSFHFERKHPPKHYSCQYMGSCFVPAYLQRSMRINPAAGNRLVAGRLLPTFIGGSFTNLDIVAANISARRYLGCKGMVELATYLIY